MLKSLFGIFDNRVYNWILKSKIGCAEWMEWGVLEMEINKYKLKICLGEILVSLKYEIFTNRIIYLFVCLTAWL